MNIVNRIIITIVVGILLWLLNTYVPMEARIKKLVNAIVIIVLVVWWLLWALALAGISTGM